MKELSQSLQNEITEKGFVVYNYISFSELMQTVQKDYLSLLSVINIPLAIISIITGIVNIYFLPILLACSYGILFFIIFIKLFARTKLFFHINNVIFTEKNILIGNNVFEYTNSEEKTDILEKYSKEFEEYLAQPSKLKTVIQKKEKALLHQTKKIISPVLQASRIKTRNNKPNPIVIAVLAYGASLFIFYYLGRVFGAIIFGIFSIFIKLAIYLKKSIELQMKNSVEKIETDIHVLRYTEKTVAEKLSRFNDGEISNLEHFIDEKFTSFYEKIEDIIAEKNILEEIIKKSPHTKFIDFPKFTAYIKMQYNKPVQNMLEVLETYAEKTQKEIDTMNENLAPQVAVKKLRLETMLKNITENTSKLSAMQL